MPPSTDPVFTHEVPPLAVKSFEKKQDWQAKPSNTSLSWHSLGTSPKLPDPLNLGIKIKDPDDTIIIKEPSVAFF